MKYCAIIGTGAIAATHIQGFLAQGDRCRVVAVSDIYADRAQAISDKFGLNAKIYSDYREMLKDPQIDLVAICTPPATHCAITVDALRAGKHVLLEKPMAPSLEECDVMIEEAKRAGKILSVVAQYRYTGQYYRLKKLLESSEAGRALHLAVNAVFYRGTEYYDLDWRGRWKTEGGGCTLIHAIHFIDQLLWLCGMPDRIYALISNLAHNNSEVEDCTEAILRYENGLVGRLTSSLVHHGEPQGIAIQTERGGIGVPFKPLASRALENGFPVSDDEAAAKLQAAYDAIELPALRGHAGQIADVLNALDGLPSTYVTGEEGRAALELVQAIYKSAATASEVALPLAKDDPFYRKETMVPLMPVFHEKTRSVQGFATSTITVGGTEYIEKK